MQSTIDKTEGAWPVAMTVAGSDSGGGAGIQADLHTFFAHDVFGTTAITCVTAQSPSGVSAIQAVPPHIVIEQISQICSAFPVCTAKTGMLFSAEIIRGVAEEVKRLSVPHLVVDPVMVAASGAKLLRDDAVEALCADLIPLAAVITPNMHEAELLAAMQIKHAGDLLDAARILQERFGVACVVKGGHLETDELVDVLVTGTEEVVLRGRKLQGVDTHGAGCTFSAALAAALAQGKSLPAAFRQAQSYVYGALEKALSVGAHKPMNHKWQI